MPSGKVHHRIWRKAWPLAVGVSAGVLTAGYPLTAAFALGGYLAGAIVEPDLDQVGITSSEGYVLKHLGCFGALWVAYWLPYGKIMPHRSFLSHFPGVSTLLRLVYLLAPAAYVVNRYALYRPWMAQALVGVWIGLTVSDTLHFVADVVSKEVRRRKR